MRVLITGSNGQLGSEIKVISGNFPRIEFLFTDVAELDIAERDRVHEFFTKNRPDYVVNCAAYTAVDRAEQEVDLANRINGLAPGILAEACEAFKARLIHISTDYVFDGKWYKPYNEDDPVSPESAYGRSKLIGEKAVQKSNTGMIIRTSWLYSSFGSNFVKTIIRNARIKPELRVVSDQIGSPTWAHDLASAILAIVDRGDESFVPGIYHYSNEGVCSWYDFAREIIDLQHIRCKVIPIETKDYPLPAKRPAYSVLNKSKIRNLYALEIPHWKDSLTKCLKLINDI
jgi:dTDP-4-dehydrorhamnose reductase